MATNLRDNKKLEYVFFLMISVIITLGMTTRVKATGYNVTKTTDTNDGACDSDCSLREAIIFANLNPGSDTISIPSGTFTLSISGQSEDGSQNGDLDISGDVSIIGSGSDKTVVNGNNIDRVIHVLPGAVVTVSDITVTGGKTADGERGGGINNAGKLTIINSSIKNNIAYASNCFNSLGGGIYNGSELDISYSSISENTSTWGGGVLNDATMTVINTSITQNFSSNGGGIRNGYGTNPTLTIVRSTINLNSATRVCVSGGIMVGTFAGGIFNSGNLVISDSSVSANISNSGGSIYNYPASSLLTINGSTINGNSHLGVSNQSGVVRINNSTISGNGNEGLRNLSSGLVTLANVTITANHGSYGGVINESGSSCVVKNTIIAGNSGTSSPDLNGIFTSAGFNLIGKSNSSTGFTNGVNGDQVGTTSAPIDPKLGVLQNNEGPTLTHALLYSSPALNAGNGSGCTDHNNNLLTSDQRGITRPQGSACDVGSFESVLKIFLPLIIRE